MKIINYISSLIIPLFILITLFIGIKEKKPIFELFTDGAKDGVNTVIKIFPNLIALFFAINVFQTSGLLNFITSLINPLTSSLGIPQEILPLSILRPISGSGSMALLQKNLEIFGVDSYLGKVAATIMGAGETTFFTIAIYCSITKIKIPKKLIISALAADTAVILSSIYIYKFF